MMKHWRSVGTWERMTRLTKGGSYALNAAMRKTPLVLALHYADMTATQDEQDQEES